MSLKGINQKTVLQGGKEGEDFADAKLLGSHDNLLSAGRASAVKHHQVTFFPDLPTLAERIAAEKTIYLLIGDKKLAVYQFELCHEGLSAYVRLTVE